MDESLREASDRCISDMEKRQAKDRRDRFAMAALTGLLSQDKSELRFSNRRELANLAANIGQFTMVSVDSLTAELDKQ